METLRLAHSSSAANLPGSFPSRDTWVYVSIYTYTY